MGPGMQEPGLSGSCRDPESPSLHQPAWASSAAGTRRPSGLSVPWSLQLSFQ